MKSFTKAINITIVLNLLLLGTTTAQNASVTVPAPAPAPADPQALSIIEDKTSGFNEMFRHLISARAQQAGGKVLVIPTAEIKPQEVLTMMEDMTVMCRIFDKKLAQSNLFPGHFLGGGIVISTPFLHDSRSIEAIYVQGYGALFFTKVDFPLSPPLQTQEEEQTEEKEEDADPVWEQMKREMYEPEDVSRRRRSEDRPEEKYDAEKVENLKTTLIKALKHAANIRGLKPNESAVLTVTGKVGEPGQLVTRLYSSGDQRYVITEPGAGTGSSSTVLIIRVKKSDIDAFADGTLSFDQFSQKTQLISYPSLGENVSGPSPSSPTDIYGGRRSSNRRVLR